MLQRRAFSQALKATVNSSFRIKTPQYFQFGVARFQTKTRSYTMAASAPQIHPFTTQVVDAMRSLYAFHCFT